MTKRLAQKAEDNRKNHIAFITWWNPKKYRIVAFAQLVAVKKIQKHYRDFKEK